MSGRVAGSNPPQNSRVNRALLPSSSFIRSARRLARKNPEVGKDLHAVLALAGSWSCSVAYDLRIVFRLVVQDGDEAILLEAVGKHDEVY